MAFHLLVAVERAFFDGRRAQGTEVVRGLETHRPRQHVNVGDELARRARREQVDGLALVYPLSAVGGMYDDPGWILLYTSG